LGDSAPLAPQSPPMVSVIFPMFRLTMYSEHNILRYSEQTQRITCISAWSICRLIDGLWASVVQVIWPVAYFRGLSSMSGHPSDFKKSNLIYWKLVLYHLFYSLLFLFYSSPFSPPKSQTLFATTLTFEYLTKIVLIQTICTTIITTHSGSYLRGGSGGQ